MSRKVQKPFIFDIHHGALDDGPGIRTTVFFKGCPLSCIWCHNPESMNCHREIAFHSKFCMKCGDCLDVCPAGAVDLDSEQRIRRDKCTFCGKCAEICPTTALRFVGAFYSATELVEILLKDRIFYKTSKGGVTFSGGEPLLYPDYLASVAKALKRKGVDIAIQTSGMFDLPEVQTSIFPYINSIYYDIKLFSNEEHIKYTGSPNGRILENFIRLAGSRDVEIIPRVPLVPHITATRDNLAQIAGFLGSEGCRNYELLPYNSGGIEKRRLIGVPIPKEVTDLLLDMGEEKKWQDFFHEQFLACHKR